MNPPRTQEAEEVSQGGTRNPDFDLDQLIEERKLERRKMLKEKLHQKLKIIRDRRVSGVSNDPFPEGAFERLKSNKIWDEVLTYLTDPCDVTSAYFACGTFAKILRGRRMLMMLPKVLNVFKTKVDKAYEFKNRKLGKMRYDVWNGICLSARGVCKAWKEVVDSHCDISRDEWFLAMATEREHGLRANIVTFHVDDEESVHEATSLINEGFTISPIRDMCVSVGDRSEEEYCSKLMQHLKAHGGSVRFLNFDYNIARPNTGAVSERLEDILKCMENLKELDISFYDQFDEELAELEEPDEENGEAMNVRPIPVLESVVHFSCHEGQTEQLFISHVLKKCINLKSVNLFSLGPTPEVITEALMTLSLERFIGCPSVITSNNQAQWPLRYLELPPYSELNASELFPAINRFRETLEHLSFRRPVRMDVDTRLELFNLKSVSLRSICRWSLGFDELLPLKSLEKVIVEFMDYENENAVVKVKRYLESKEMEKCNVWQCFQNLKWLRLSGFGHRDKLFRRPLSP